MNFLERLILYFDVGRMIPLLVSLAAGLVAMFAAFAGLGELMAAAGKVCGAGALIFFVLISMG
jgi:hypothetical protein